MRKSFSKSALMATSVLFFAFNAFAVNLPRNCTDEIMDLSKRSDFDMQKFAADLPTAVAKAKEQAKFALLSFGKPKDHNKMAIGISFGCLKSFPESPSEIQSLLIDINRKILEQEVPQIQAQFQPQQIQPEEQTQYQPLQQPQQCQCHCHWSEQRQVVNMEKRRKVQKLIEDGLENNKVEIEMESVYLSPADVEALYYRNSKKNAIGYAALSGTIGLGIGSYIQGNIPFGITQTIIDGIALCILNGSGYSHYMRFAIGESTMVLSRIAGLIVPFVHQNNYNEDLKAALNGIYSLSYSIDPLIIPKDGPPAVGLALNLRY